MTLKSLSKKLIYSDFLDRIAAFAEDEMFPLRSLTRGEIRELELQGNHCSNWSSVMVSEDFKTEAVRNCLFYGDVRIGRLSSEFKEINLPWAETMIHPGGLNSSVIANCWINNDVSIHRCAMLQNVHIGEGSLIFNSNFYSSTHANSFANGSEISLGIETGGREIKIFADLSLELAQFVLDNPGNSKIRDEFNELVDNYREQVYFDGSIVDAGAVIIDTPRIYDSFIGCRAYVHQSLGIENSTIMSTSYDRTKIGPGSLVRGSIIQEGVRIDSGALIKDSMLFEHSHATEHGRVNQCIVGPNSGVSLGEASSSFIGPFVGFHHQSLLIACYWPGGRGNIGYGANVGSNHTSRVPDQECWPGEGMFFGLSSVIKFPANFRQAPYTIVAAGVTTLPQKMTCPFSLINEPVAYFLEVPPGFNNLIPAWGLTENLYSLKRNEVKYKRRNKAVRNRFDLDLFRPEILEYMRKAATDLKNIKERKTIYLPSDIPAIGKNMMTDENRLKAIEAYEYFIEFVDLRKLRNEIFSKPKAELEELDKEAKDEVRAKMRRYLEMISEILRRIISSRLRDFDRGKAIIDDYAETHEAVDQDHFIIESREESEEDSRQTEFVLKVLG